MDSGGAALIESLLIHGAVWLRSACAAVADGFAWLWSAVVALLNPVLSPALGALSPLFTVCGDAMFGILSPLGRTGTLCAVSVLVGIASLIVFRYASNQKAIGRALDAIKANLLALKLFKDDLRVTFASQGRLLAAVARLQWHMILPFLVMLVPMLPVLAQTAARYQWRPLQTGERALIKAAVRTSGANHPAVRIDPPNGIEVEVDGIPGAGTIVWRVRATAPGRHNVSFRFDGGAVEKEIVIGDDTTRVSAMRPGASWTDRLLHPTERPIPTSAPIESIEITYPSTHSYIHGADWWVLSFFVISMITALVLRPLFRVRF